jgi:hypothetical protein
MLTNRGKGVIIKLPAASLLIFSTRENSIELEKHKDIFFDVEA